MASVLDICQASALNIGAVQSGETLEAGEAADILAAWQRLISSSNLLSNTVFSVRKDSYTLTPGTQAYTLGTNPVTSAVGTLSAVRPSRITGMNLVASGSNIVYSLDRLEAEDWQKLCSTGTTGAPSAYYFDHANPLATLTFNSTPDQAYQVDMYSWDKLPQQLNLSDTVVFPDGYERYWTLKLAIEIAPMFAMTPSPTLVAIALEAEQNVRSFNSRSPRLSSNHGLKRRHGVWFDARYFVPGMGN